MSCRTTVLSVNKGTGTENQTTRSRKRTITNASDRYVSVRQLHSSCSTCPRCMEVKAVTEGASESGGESSSVGLQLEDEEEEDDTPDRPSERFMVIDLGEADCTKCGYHYEPKRGDPEYPIASGTQFSALPGDWTCPLCGASKMEFRATSKEIAGFAENQGYGFGTNSMTAGQKNLLIYGSLLFFFMVFISGYLLD